MNIIQENRPQPEGKTIFQFINQATPTIVNYDRDYAAKYGQFPTVRLIINPLDNKGYQSAQMPQFTFVNGQIEEVYFDLGDAFSGCMVLSW